ncbi:MAG TPA: hypothetical protein VGK23_10260 [Methanomassiliicoccales archaeon]|jgi:hypothetical protein
MNNVYSRGNALSLRESGEHMKERPKVASRQSPMKRLADLEADINEIKISINTLKETRAILPVCTSLKEKCHGKSLIGMLEGDISDPKAFRQRIMND